MIIPQCRYAWEHSPWDGEIADAPPWLLALVSKSKPDTLNFGNALPERGGAYLHAALQNQLATLMRTASGSRNDQLNKSAFALGQLVVQGLDEQEVRRKLEAVAFALGLDQNETKRTIDSGITAGMATPRTDKTDTTPVSSVMSVDNQTVSAEQWPDPLPIIIELPAVNAFDPDRLLPSPLREWVMDTAGRMPCPPDFVAATVVVALGSIVGARCAIKPKRFDDWAIVPNLWGGIVGQPSAKKSPAISAALKPLDSLIVRASKEYEEEREAFDTGKAERDARQAALVKKMKKAADAELNQIDEDKNEKDSQTNF